MAPSPASPRRTRRYRSHHRLRRRSCLRWPMWSPRSRGLTPTDDPEELTPMATGTLVDVVMPQMGVSVSEGTITRWAKAVGETIEADETIVEISTDKVDTEVPSPATGLVRELFAGEGETVPVNTQIAIIDTGGGTD